VSSQRRLVLLRHGRTAWNHEGRAQGHADVPLDEVGHAQAAAAAPHLAALGPVALWSSDLARARQTASYVEAATGLVATPDPRLREYDVGMRTGLTLAELADKHPEEHAAWLRTRSWDVVPGAESAAEVTERVVAALRDCLAALEPGETGVVVAHGACLKVSLLALLGLPLEADRALVHLDNCGWASVVEQHHGQVRLTSYNQTAPEVAATPVGTP
jgi:probable phosphoglycerate mutase